MGILRKNNRRGVSIKYKFILFILIVVLIIVCSVGSVCYSMLSSVLVNDITNEMNLIVGKDASLINEKLYRMKDAADSVNTYVINSIESAYDLADPTYRQQFQQQFESVFVSTSQNTQGIIACYVRFNPDIVGDGRQGFTYREDEKGRLTLTENQDLEEHGSEDSGYAGWYYDTVSNHRPTWTAPYYDSANDELTISYVVPIYKDNVLAGVVGISMDFNDLMSYVSTFTVLENGYAYLKSGDGSIHYHPDYYRDTGAHGDEVDMITENADKMNGESTSGYMIRYQYQGNDRVMTFKTLANGMKLVICDSYTEVFSGRKQLIDWIVIFAFIIGTGVVIAGSIFANEITKPIMALRNASNRIAGGSFDVKLPPVTNDEIGELTGSFQTVIDHLRAYTGEMESLAYVDQMTRVKNKAAFCNLKMDIDEMIKDGAVRFAFVMCDLNYLKVINDTYGHQAGDEALITTAEILCKAFPRSSVYRIGGDEFIVVLMGNEYDIREELIADFNEELSILERSEEHRHVSIAYGEAAYDPSTDINSQSVYGRADDSMYAMKKLMHEESGTDLR
ncbi:MAG: diguanylate cyclase [Mageeibacillus sp.]|jgi:diguanylate cyclase (GGDEF)-like protein|nr:diguanylate cyclase [Mageeibacillus sp.]